MTNDDLMDSPDIQAVMSAEKSSHRMLGTQNR